MWSNVSPRIISGSDTQIGSGITWHALPQREFARNLRLHQRPEPTKARDVLLEILEPQRYLEVAQSGKLP